MKRIICILMFTLLLLSGCGARLTFNEQPNELLMEYVENIEEYETRVMEYASEDNHVHEEVTECEPTEVPTEKPTELTKEDIYDIYYEEMPTSSSSEYVRYIDPEKPMLALTFDDGPSPHTERLLDVFNQYGGKGTFFVIGNLIDRRMKILQRISDEGHEIANHSWSHERLTTLEEMDVIDQIMLTRAKLYSTTGKDSLIVRPPYGAYDENLLEIGKKLGVYFVTWSVDTLDWKYKDAEVIYDYIVNNVSDGDIVLCHDLHETTVDAMEKVIPKLVEDGYQLVTVSELLSFSKKGIEPGVMYYKR